MVDEEYIELTYLEENNIKHKINMKKDTRLLMNVSNEKLK